MKYRAEIDGLRAIAVIPVILFHAGYEHFSGGFVGVDIFFVISGYLITTIILSEKENGTFTIGRFYERRARRILPALFLVMGISLPFAWLWLFPADLEDFYQSLVAVSTFTSNILFWRETGYWGVENEFKPLLHTWSLAVEEQYYVLFPLFLAAMWRFNRKWILVSFLVLALASLALSQWGAYNKPTANFFLLLTRAWELAIGAIIAFILIYHKQATNALLSNNTINDALSLLGLILICFAVFVFSETTPFPSLYALVPTIGTGLIILFASEHTWVGRSLGSKIPVGIGLISYSAYLWHQPLFSFLRHRSLSEPNQYYVLALVALTFLLAYLSWKYVEIPFRQKGRLSRNTVVLFGAAGSFAFIAIGLVGSLTDARPGFLTASSLSPGVIEHKRRINNGLSEECEGSFTLSPACRTSDKPEIVVWGDSYAMHLTQGILASRPNAKIIQFTKSTCGPFFDISPSSQKYTKKWAEGCLDFNTQVHNWISSSESVKYVVISSLFYQYLSSDYQLLSRDGEVTDTNLDSVISEFTATLNALEAAGVIPVIFSPPPSNSVDLGRCLAKTESYGLEMDLCDFDPSGMSPARREAYRLLDSLSEDFRIVRLDELICDEARCRSHLESTWLYRDSGHLSHEGSAALGKKYDFYNLITGVSDQR